MRAPSTPPPPPPPSEPAAMALGLAMLALVFAACAIGLFYGAAWGFTAAGGGCVLLALAVILFGRPR